MFPGTRSPTLSPNDFTSSPLICADTATASAPTRAANTTSTIRSWHWALMAHPYDFPERMMAAVPAQGYMEKKLSEAGIGLGFFDPTAFAEYVRCFNWKTIKGSCADYRACPTCDFEMDKA